MHTGWRRSLKRPWLSETATSLLWRRHFYSRQPFRNKRDTCAHRLEAQLEEALAQRDIHKPAIDIDTPADKTLKLLDKIMRGHDVSVAAAGNRKEKWKNGTGCSCRGCTALH